MILILCIYLQYTGIRGIITAGDTMIRGITVPGTGETVGFTAAGTGAGHHRSTTHGTGADGMTRGTGLTTGTTGIITTTDLYMLRTTITSTVREHPQSAGGTVPDFQGLRA